MLQISLLRRLQAQSRPDASPSIGKINQSFKIAVTLKPVMQFRCPLRFRISDRPQDLLFYERKHHLHLLGRGGKGSLNQSIINEQRYL